MRRALIRYRAALRNRRRPRRARRSKAPPTPRPPEPVTTLPPGITEPADTTPAPIASAPKEDVGGGDWNTDDLSFDEVDDTSKVASVNKRTEGSIVVHHYRYLRTPDLPDGAPPAASEDIPAGRDSVELIVETKATTGDATAMARVSARRDLSEPTRDRVGVIEAYGAIERSSLRVRAGYLIEAWGSASLYNPSDVLNPIDYRDPLDPEKLGNWMLRASWLAGPVSIEGYYIPVPAPHLLPAVEGISRDGQLLGRSRWVGGSLAPTDVDTPPTLLLGALETRRPTLGNAQGALRVAVTTPTVDFAVSYAYLFDHFATPALTMLGPTTVRVDFAYDRQHILTAEAETVSGKFRYAAEAAAVFPRRDAPADPNASAAKPISYVSGVLSAEYKTAQFNGDHHIQVFVDLTLTSGLSESLPDDPMTQLRFPFRRAALARVQYNAGSDLRVALDVAEAVDRFDLLVGPSIAYQFGTMMEVELGMWWLDGDGSGFFGAYKDNSRVSIKLEASY